jgi:hypothetical protein
MNRYILSIGPILVLFLISSCICPLTSVKPLSDLRNSIYDERIEGAWQLVSADKDLVFLHFGKGQENKTKMISVEHKNNGSIDVLTFTVFPTIIAGNSYLNFNIKELFEELSDELSGYTFMKYQLPDSDSLVLSLIDKKPVIEAIESGKLKGEITYQKFKKRPGQENPVLQQNVKDGVKCVKIKDSSNNIVKYFQSLDSKKLFPESIIFKRITEVTP